MEEISKYPKENQEIYNERNIEELPSIITFNSATTYKQKMTELLSKYKKVHNDESNEHSYPVSSMYDYQSFIELQRGIDCTQYGNLIYGETNIFGDLFGNTSEIYSNLTENDNVTLFNDKTCMLMKKNRTVRIDLGYMPTSKSNLETSNGRIPSQMEMYEITSEGIYCFNADFSSAVIYFMSNDTIQTYYGSEKTLDELKKMIVSGEKHFLMTERKTIPIDLQKHGDIAILANMVYTNGIQSILQVVKEGKKIEINSQDRKYYELTEEEKEIIQIVQSQQVSEEKVEEKAILSTNDEERIQNEKENTTKLDNISSEERTNVIEQLIALQNSGIELSSKQKSMIELYEKLNSDKFKKYKEDKDVRTKRQQEIREQIKAENERIHQWNNSPEHPANIRKEQRIELLKQLREQLKAMENLRNVAPEILTPQQLEVLQTSYVFLEMMEKSNSEVHEIDTGMSPEMKEWYYEQYTSEENKSRR